MVIGTVNQAQLVSYDEYSCDYMPTLTVQHSNCLY